MTLLYDLRFKVVTIDIDLNDNKQNDIIPFDICDLQRLVYVKTLWDVVIKWTIVWFLLTMMKKLLLTYSSNIKRCILKLYKSN